MVGRRQSTYVDEFPVGVIDESIKEDTDTLVAPDSQELMHVVELIWRRHRQPVIDTRQVTQVEDVVELGRRRRQIANHGPDVHTHHHITSHSGNGNRHLEASISEKYFFSVCPFICSSVSVCRINPINY